MDRVITYIDGYNLYFALKSRSWQKYYWLDIVRLSESITPKDSTFLRCKYFTARVNGGSVQRRQSAYLEALDTLDNLDIIYGRYAMRTRKCSICQQSFKSPEEKMTDVNIAVSMVSDGHKDNFDTAILISGDTDLIPPTRELTNIGKRVIVAFPPHQAQHESQKIKDACTSHFRIGEAKIRQSQLSNVVRGKNGYDIKKPAHWT